MRLGRIIAWSLAAGLWWACVVVLPWFVFGGLDDVLAGIAREQVRLANTTALARIPLLDASPAWAWWLLPAVCAALACAAVLLVLRVLDPSRMSRDAVRWIVRTGWSFGAWCAGLGAIASLAGPAAARWPSLALVAWFAPLAWLAVWPFVVLRRDVLVRDVPPDLWTPRWPGLPSVALLVLSLLPSIVALALRAPGTAPGFGLAAANAVATLLLSLWMIVAWRSHARWRALPGCARDAARWATLRVVLAVDLRLLAIVLLVVLPVVLMLQQQTLHTLPGLPDALARSGQSVPAPVRWLALASAWTGNLLWLVGGPAMLWASLAGRGRALALLDARTGA